MKLLWLFFILPAVFGQTNFGNSYLKNTRLCHHWNCINAKLGFPDWLPPRFITEDIFKRILPQGEWQTVIHNVLDTCYNNRPRLYSNTCPGQGILHCVVDQMIENCPQSSQQKGDACTPITSLAGLKYMFSQSRYHNLEQNLAQERRPEWFMKHYFEQKCCELPTIFNTTTLEECGFSKFINYYTHEPRPRDGVTFKNPIIPQSQTDGDALKVVALDQTGNPTFDSNIDALDCCDIKEFIQPSWRSDCDFHLNWRGHKRLVIANNTFGLTTEAPVPTTTADPNPPKDIMLLPQSCEQETCLFKSIGVINEAGTINTVAYMNMLTNFSDANPNWKKAMGRVVTKCITRRARRYDNECEINKMLSCTLDVLSENCPYNKKLGNKCRHNKGKGGCQISSAKYSPKYRREVCLLPQLIHKDNLHQCGLMSMYKVDHVVVTTPKPRKYSWATQYMCQDQKPSTTCLMTKMGILNKYKFMDYFRMKDKIRQFTSNQPEWSSLLDIYMSAFINLPMYGEHCSSQKKLLNVVDAMLMTCPISKRLDTPQCQKFYKNITDMTPIDNHNITRQKLDEIFKHYEHIFLPKPKFSKLNRVIRKKHSKVFTKPIYNYGLLDSGNSPKVKTIDIKPVVITRLDKPLVLAPVYLRDPKLNIASPFHNDGVFRNNPYWLHDRIPKVRFTTPHTNTLMNPGNIKQPITTPMIPTGPIEPIDSPLRMIKPE